MTKRQIDMAVERNPGLSVDDDRQPGHDSSQDFQWLQEGQNGLDSSYDFQWF